MVKLTASDAPILRHPTAESSVFLPENLLNRAATMQGKERGPIPPCCVLDFDAELVPVAVEMFGARACDGWACFHTTLLRIERDGFSMGLIAGTVGAPYAVLVAEELIASGCRHIVGYASAGMVADWLQPPCLVVPEGAYREWVASILPSSARTQWQDAGHRIVRKDTAGPCAASSLVAPKGP